MTQSSKSEGAGIEWFYEAIDLFMKNELTTQVLLELVKENILAAEARGAERERKQIGVLIDGLLGAIHSRKGEAGL